MQHSPSYSYSHPMAGHSRYASTHASSSAFSASANPNEDWTKISDLAERRRIQNRIAQRNYRKKLKRRLEDLERRAGSSSASPEQQHSELASTSSTDSRHSHPMTRQSSKHSISHDAQQMSPELLPLDDHSLLFGSSRTLPVTPPPLLYSTYPPTTSYLEHEYQHHSSYHPSHQSYPYEYHYPTEYSHSLPPTLPTMLPSPYSGKQEPMLGEDDLMNPFAMNYASLAGLDLPSSQTFASPSSQSHTPPLTDPFSIAGSPYQSPSYFELPLTPVSRSASPHIHLFDIPCN